MHANAYAHECSTHVHSHMHTNAHNVNTHACTLTFTHNNIHVRTHECADLYSHMLMHKLGKRACAPCDMSGRRIALCLSCVQKLLRHGMNAVTHPTHVNVCHAKRQLLQKERVEVWRHTEDNVITLRWQPRQVPFQAKRCVGPIHFPWCHTKIVVHDFR